MSLDLIKELISEELINKINKKVKQERKIIDEKWIGEIIDFNDIENIMACEIFLDYYQIPLIELQDIIYKEYKRLETSLVKSRFILNVKKFFDVNLDYSLIPEGYNFIGKNREHILQFKDEKIRMCLIMGFNIKESDEL